MGASSETAGGSPGEPRASALKGLRVVVIEDGLHEALALEELLRRIGCMVVGPFATLDSAEHAIRAGELDAALLDVSVAGEESYGLATLLRDARVPFIFLTGYDVYLLPEEWQTAPCMEKPVDSEALIAAMRREFARV
jgi:DNA-binding response OmpR family regulator